MKKKILLGIILSAGLIGSPVVAEATEINENGLENLTVESVIEDDGIIGIPEVEGPNGSIEKPEGHKPVIKPEAEDAGIIGTPEVEGPNGSIEKPGGDKPVIKPEAEDAGIIGTPEVEGPNGSIEKPEGHKPVIKPEAVKPNVDDGTHEDDMGQVSENAMEQLQIAIEEMRIAMDLLNKEGITSKNKKTILTFAATSLERVRPFFDELQNDSFASGHLNWINESYGVISDAVDKFVPGIPGDIVAPVDPDFGMNPDLENPVDPDFGVDSEVPGIPGDIVAPVDPDFEMDHDLENPIDPDFGMKPELEFPLTGDGSAEDDFQVDPELEFPSTGDGSAEDDFQVDPELEFPSTGDGSAEDDFQVDPEEEKEEENKVPATGTNTQLPVYVAGLAGLAFLKKLLKK